MDIALDSSNNVYVAGNSGIVKYNGSTGGKQWTVQSDMPHNKIAVDALGNIYFYNPVLPLTVLKYNSLGTKLWESAYTSGSDNVSPTDIVVDPCGNCFVCGNLSTTGIATIKFSSTGEFLWDSIHPITGTSYCSSALACDQWGNTYLSTVYNSSLMTYKNDSDGEEIWNMTYVGSFAATTLPVIFVKSGEVYVASSGTVSGQANNLFTIQYNQKFCKAFRLGDVNKDCIIDFLDFAAMAQFWMECNKYPSSECN
jgi:hypothetical protein